MRQRAVLTVSSLRSRAAALASRPLRGVTGDFLSGALGKVEERLRGPVGGVRSLERMREVLERDRALASAEHPTASASRLPAPPKRREPASTHLRAAPAPVELAPDAPVELLCDEPIRTRTMARLLGSQGYLQRALSIYAYLMQQHPGDSALMDEVARLRAGHSESAASVLAG